MKKASLVVALSLLAAYVVTGAHATPWFTQDPRTLPEGKWRVEEHLLFSDIDEGLGDGHSIPLPGGITEASSLTFHTRIRYGVRDDLTAFVDVPFVDKRVHTPTGVLENSGLGDLNFLLKWKYADSRERGTRRSVAAFYKPHNGEYRNLSGLLATGSGQDNLGLVHLWEWRRGGTTWYANTGYVFRDSRSDTGVDPGGIILFNGAAEHQIGDGPWKAVWELNGQRVGSSDVGGVTTPNTNSTVISLSPGVQYTKKKPGGPIWNFELGVQIPVITEGDRPAIPDETIYAGAYVIF